MFGDAMYEEEDRLRRAAQGDQPPESDDERQDLMAAGGLDEHLRRREAIAQLLSEVGGC